jgi:hypothetical protein
VDPVAREGEMTLYTTGKHVMPFQIDDEDFERVSRHNWGAYWIRNGGGKDGSWRVARGISVSPGQRRLQLLARFLVEANAKIDHKDRDTLNNQKANLRPCTTSQNGANCKRRETNTTGFKGVRRNGSRYMARIKVNGRELYLGTYDTPEEAHQVYMAAARKYFGEFARAE